MSETILELEPSLLRAGVKDYFDRIIYAIAMYYKSLSLTKDKELREILDSIPKPQKIINWNEIINVIA